MNGGVCHITLCCIPANDLTTSPPTTCIFESIKVPECQTNGTAKGPDTSEVQVQVVIPALVLHLQRFAPSHNNLNTAESNKIIGCG